MPGFNDAENWCDANDRAKELIALRDRVKELEDERDLLKTQRDNVSNRERYHLEECARRGKVVDAARQYKKATESRDMPEFKLERALFDSIDELDGEKKCEKCGIHFPDCDC